jgi:hypothetical protein
MELLLILVCKYDVTASEIRRDSPRSDIGIILGLKRSRRLRHLSLVASLLAQSTHYRHTHALLKLRVCFQLEDEPTF